MMNFESTFLQAALILAGSALLGALLLKLRQPLIIAFIAIGILVGPSGIDVISHSRQFQLLAEMGIALLLFAVGLKLDLHLVRTMGPVALATGLGQVLFTSVFGFLLALAIALPAVSALYVAFALTFSSTIIIVKLLSDKREIDALHGRIAVGFLIVQDIAVIFAMIGLTAMGAGRGGQHLWLAVLLVLLKGVVLLGGLFLGMRFLSRLLEVTGRSKELLLLAAVAWAFLFAAMGDLLGFSKEIGAFLAGVALASTAYREAIISRLVSLRDFLLLFFFINLGAQLDLSALGAQVGPALLFSAFVLVGNPLIVMIIMGVMGYRRRTGFLAGLTVAQISEFSLILGALGVGLGHIGREVLGLITLVGLLTISLSTYMILYSHQLYARLGPWLGIFERRQPYRETARDSAGEPEWMDVLLFGLGRYGRQIAENLVRRGKKVLAVDFDPQVISGPLPGGIRVRYGDAEDPEMLEHLPLQRVGWVVNAIPGRDLNLGLLKSLREKGYRGRVVLTAHNREEAGFYRRAGADKVLWPFADAAEQAVDVLTASLDEISALAPWPFALEEVRIRADSVARGKKLAELALRPRTGVSVVAVDRSGRSHFDPSSEFVVFPGDRLVLLGTEEGLRQARYLLEEPEAPPEGEKKFVIEEIPLSPGWSGMTLAGLELRRRFGVTVIGIRRGEEMIVSPLPEEELRRGDILVVIGQHDRIRLCREGGVPSFCP